MILALQIVSNTAQLLTIILIGKIDVRKFFNTFFKILFRCVSICMWALLHYYFSF